MKAPTRYDLSLFWKYPKGVFDWPINLNIIISCYSVKDATQIRMAVNSLENCLHVPCCDPRPDANSVSAGRERGQAQFQCALPPPP